MKRGERVFQIDIGIGIRVILQYGEFRPVWGSMAPNRKGADIRNNVKNLIAAG
jgi:hypothetical protein